MEWNRIPLGLLQTNCYILWNDDKDCIIFDPGDEGEKLCRWIDQQQLKPVAVLLTHAHFDHIGAVDKVRESYHVPVHVHENEAKWLLDPSLNGSQLFLRDRPIRVKPADVIISVEKELVIGPFRFQLLETPGHSPGSLSYYSPELQAVFCGDTLFNGSIGRTDLPGGNHDELLNSIHERLLTLPEETTVLPGHGPETSIENEMDGNPFLNGF